MFQTLNDLELVPNGKIGIQGYNESKGFKPNILQVGAFHAQKLCDALGCSVEKRGRRMDRYNSDDTFVDYAFYNIYI